MTGESLIRIGGDIEYHLNNSSGTPTQLFGRLLQFVHDGISTYAVIANKSGTVDVVNYSQIKKIDITL